MNQETKLTNTDLLICFATGVKWITEDAISFGKVKLWYCKPKYNKVTGRYKSTPQNYFCAFLKNTAFKLVQPKDCIDFKQAYEEAKIKFLENHYEDYFKPR